MPEQSTNMLTNLGGRIRNTPLSITSGLMPLFEAVVKSLHAIDEASVASDNGRIRIEILRKTRQSTLSLATDKKHPGPDALEDIIGFKITDNGIGFNDENMRSFQELDTDHKADKGCRGIGRLLWLKAFKRVYVHSTYFQNNAGFYERSFKFDFGGVSELQNATAPAGAQCQTVVHLDDFAKQYRDNARKTAQAIATSVLEHCLWYFIRPGSAPQTVVIDNLDTISLNDEFDSRMHSSATQQQIRIKGELFELTHVKRSTNALSSNTIAFCAANRLVLEEKIDGKIPGLFGKLHDGAGEFVYSCYVSSTFLDKSVRPERTGFAILDTVDGLLAETEIGLAEIKSLVLEEAKTQLAPFLQKNIERSRARVETFVDKKAPRYKAILSRIPKNEISFDPNISDKDLDVELHKELAKIERELLSEGHEILVPKGAETQKDYEQRIAAYLSKAADIKKSDLANYVAHRRVILDLLEQAIQRKPDGSYVREELIHKLIMPMVKESTEVHLDSCNLWLVDERLAFHDFLASDKTLASMPITGSSDTKEPDLCSLSVYDNPVLVNEGTQLPLASIVIVEIKRPMRNDATAGEETDPVEQAIGYLNRIRKGKVSTKGGRLIPDSMNIPGYCYVIADLTSALKDRCKVHHDLQETADHMGYFGYKKNSNAYVEVLSLDRLVNAAKERNRAFFDKLGLPAS